MSPTCKVKIFHERKALISLNFSNKDKDKKLKKLVVALKMLYFRTVLSTEIKDLQSLKPENLETCLLLSALKLPIKSQ